MIGVIHRPGQRVVVEEFFQLFKTPWELCRDDQSYDVVVATADEVPEVNARLLVVFGTEVRANDASNGVVASGSVRQVLLNYRGMQVPIYGGALLFGNASAGVPCVQADIGIVGLRIDAGEKSVLRLGYDLFDEIALLLSVGQPLENAHIPALEIHVTMLRDWMLEAGIAFVEIPPVPAKKSFIACLTHDIDFVGIRYHKFDHTMWGFLYRSTVGAVRDFSRRRISLVRLLKIWKAVASLPLVFLGWMKDFWVPFGWYLEVERNLRSTYFLIPFKNRPGEKISVRHAERRATKYDVADIREWMKTLLDEGCEVGVHGIDAWHSVEKGRAELERVSTAASRAAGGIRMHWLLRDESSYRILEEAGYVYDSTDGYNETIGYRRGTTQVFRPLGRRNLLELPMHIQDGALFFPQRLDLSETDAWRRCAALIDNAERFGGVLTLLWHDRSHGPERFWGGFYVRLVNKLKSLDVWFGTATQVVEWFRKRRQISFERANSADGTSQVRLRYNGEPVVPPAALRIHHPADTVASARSAAVRGCETLSLSGETDIDVDRLLRAGNVLDSAAVSRRG